ncbi:Ig-like domain-containing protein [Pelagicoccus enzymogenes]|uniref:Ig-like domain-containing protein n=1 Tax=Pelagicoccus enzymogenes TaxID=2773457 RepID=UPI0028102B44|nr:Ig-like domain-containing protein [Pelagicoccus enzymogenes]MDQ8199292.1 Ig-like domain-containing protein [Pelagicoccus enzymogenes]
MQLTSSRLNPTSAKWLRLLAGLATFSLSAAALADDVVLTWSDNSDNEDGFNIERAAGDGVFETIAQVGADVQTYTDATAVEGVDYQYRVNAYNAFGYSGYTNVASHYINVAPTITAVQDFAVEENQTTDPISFSVSDFETASGDLTLAVSSSNPDLVDVAGVEIEGSGAEKSFRLTPSFNTAGESTITVTVSDGEDSNSISFLFSVNAYVFPSLQLAVESIAAQPRAGESFLVTATASDASDVTSVSYWIGDELLETVTSSPFEATLAISEAGSYTLTAVATIDGREQTVTADQTLWVGAAPVDSSIVDSLATLSVEESTTAGSAGYDLASDTFTLEDQSGLIWGSSDSHRYYYLRASGDVAVEAQISALDTSVSGTVAGLMLRTALYGKSPQASLLLNGDNALSVRTRATRGSSTEERPLGSSFSATPWLRIEKTGSTIRYYSKASLSDSWSLVGSDSLDLGEEVFLGFALAGGSASGLVAAEFQQADFSGQILTMGEDAVKPSIPSGLLISSLAN